MTYTIEQLESLQTIYSSTYARQLTTEQRLNAYHEQAEVVLPEISFEDRQQVFFIFERIRNKALSF